MAAKHYESLDYDRFELHPINRSVYDVKFLERSMREVGWLDAFPMYCVTNGKKLKIKDGHNRFIAAKNIGIAVKYVIDKDHIPMWKLQKATRIWTNLNYLESYRKLRKPAYVIVDEYMKRTGIAIGAAISLLGGELSSSSNKTNSFKSGTYEIKGTEHAETIGALVVCLKGVGILWASNSFFVGALSRAVKIPALDVTVLQKKLRAHKAVIEKQPSIEGYVSMIEKIYNTRNKNPLPVLFLSDEESRKRQPKAFRKK